MTVLFSLWFAAFANTGEKQVFFEITHFPAAAYLGGRSTLVLAGTPGSEVSVALAGQSLGTHTFKTDRLELNFSFTGPGQLELSQADANFRFLLLAPDDMRRLTRTDGFLFADNVPVILLLEHRHPPKHDRRWELLRVTGNLLGVHAQPAVGQTVVLGGSYLKGTLNGQGWQHLPLAGEGWELSSMVVAMQTLRPTALLILAPSVVDVEHGMNPLDYRMRLEWLLQHVDRKKFPNVVMVWPPLTRQMIERFPEIPRFLRLAAASNEIPMLAPGTVLDSASILAAEWQRAVEKRLQKWVILER